jgi:hypothetical protein
MSIPRVAFIRNGKPSRLCAGAQFIRLRTGRSPAAVPLNAACGSAANAGGAQTICALLRQTRLAEAVEEVLIGGGIFVRAQLGSAIEKIRLYAPTLVEGRSRLFDSAQVCQAYRH